MLRSGPAVVALAAVLAAACGDSASTSAPRPEDADTTSTVRTDTPVSTSPAVSGSRAQPQPTPCPLYRSTLAPPLDYFHHQMVNVIITGVSLGGSRSEEPLPESELLFEDYIEIEWEREMRPDPSFWEGLRDLFGSIGATAETVKADVAELGAPPAELELVVSTVDQELAAVIAAAGTAAAAAAEQDIATVLNQAAIVDAAVDMIVFARDGLTTVGC